MAAGPVAERLFLATIVPTTPLSIVETEMTQLIDAVACGIRETSG